MTDVKQLELEQAVERLERKVSAEQAKFPAMLSADLRIVLSALEVAQRDVRRLRDALEDCARMGEAAGSTTRVRRFVNKVLAESETPSA